MDPHHFGNLDPHLDLDSHKKQEQDPDPHQCDKLDPEPDRINLLMTSQNVWNFGSRSGSASYKNRIRIRIRVISLTGSESK